MGALAKPLICPAEFAWRSAASRVSSPKSPNYLASHPIRIRSKKVDDDAHDPETSRSQNPDGFVTQHDLPSSLAGHISQAGVLGRTGGGMGGGRNPVLACRENRGEPQGRGLRVGTCAPMTTPCVDASASAGLIATACRRSRTITGRSSLIFDSTQAAGHCVFHEDGHASLSIHPERGAFRCFACNAARRRHAGI
jgi:CHC2 zinc finger